MRARGQWPTSLRRSFVSWMARGPSYAARRHSATINTSHDCNPSVTRRQRAGDLTDQSAAHNEPKLVHREQLDPGVALKLRSIQRQTDLRAGIDRQNRVEARAPDRASKVRLRPGIGEQNRAQRVPGAACAGTGRGKHDQGYEVRRRYASWTGHGASPFQEGSRHAVKPISSTEPVLGNDRTKAEGSQCA